MVFSLLLLLPFWHFLLVILLSYRRHRTRRVYKLTQVHRIYSLPCLLLRERTDILSHYGQRVCIPRDLKGLLGSIAGFWWLLFCRLRSVLPLSSSDNRREVNLFSGCSSFFVSSFTCLPLQQQAVDFIRTFLILQILAPVTFLPRKIVKSLHPAKMHPSPPP